MPFWRAKAAIASGVSKGTLNPTVATRNASAPSAARAPCTAFSRKRVAVGHTSKQPVYTKLTTSGRPR